MSYIEFVTSIPIATKLYSGQRLYQYNKENF